MKHLFSSIIVVLFAAFVVAGVVFAFTPPTAIPPGDNVLPPLNVSFQAQEKLGGLILGTGTPWPAGNSGFIVAQGNVGFGTTTPDSELHVRGNLLFPDGNADIELETSNSNARWTVSAEQDTKNFSIYDKINDIFPFQIEQGAPDWSVYIDSLGKVGIGTTTPQAQLEVSSAGVACTGLLPAADCTALRISQTDSDHAIWELRSHTWPTINNGFSIWGGAEGLEETRFVIEDDGDVGIGTIDPTSILNIVGANRDVRHYSYAPDEFDGADYEFMRARGTEAFPQRAEGFGGPKDKIGSIRFKGWDGDDFFTGAEIRARADGSFGTILAVGDDGDAPMRLEFLTRENTLSSPIKPLTVRMTIADDGKTTFTEKATFLNGVDPPYISFSAESHVSIREFAKDVEKHEKVMQFWNGETHRIEIYVIEEDRFYTITGELISE